MKKEMIFVGVIKKLPDCGISMKNHYFINKFKNYYDKMWIVELNKALRIKLPIKLLYIVFLAIVHPSARIVVSSNTWESDIIFRVLGKLGMTKRCYYWVPGGVFHNVVQQKFKLSTFQRLKKLYVQSPSIVKGLEQLGFTNAVYVPNSKRIDYYPQKQIRKDGLIRFVFLSRIHPDKGCDMIIDCAMRLNNMGYDNRFVVDFYGKIYDEYRTGFLERCKEVHNINYCGHLDLTQKSGYDTLASYDMMLFPTYWWGEGFPGVVIDAYIAGLPIIASDWNCNCDVIDETTGRIIHSKNANELYEEMKNAIDGHYDLRVLSKNCQEKAKQYDNDVVLSEKSLFQLGLLE